MLDELVCNLLTNNAYGCRMKESNALETSALFFALLAPLFRSSNTTTLYVAADDLMVYE